MTIAEFDHLPDGEKEQLLFNCCGSTTWVSKMMEVLPVEDLVDLLEYADEKWAECNDEDYLQAFTHHPKIGDVESLRDKFAATAGWAAGEQSGVSLANEDVLRDLALGNNDYFEKFGYIFIVCATGKSADEMLSMLRARIGNSPEDEIELAAEEQSKITRIRLEKLFA